MKLDGSMKMFFVEPNQSSKVSQKKNSRVIKMNYNFIPTICYFCDLFRGPPFGNK